MSELTIPAQLLPADGRFGSGPAKIRPEALAALASHSNLLGTSHRQPPVQHLIAEIQAMLTELYVLPDGYRVVLNNGGATTFWDVAISSLITHRSAHGVFGEFGRKFADATAHAPFLDDPIITESPAGGVAVPVATAGVDAYAWPHNETSTGACSQIIRPVGADEDSLVLIDGTSAAGGLPFDVTHTDVYYFSPQKNFSSDGGLWLALCSPAALDRAERVSYSHRWIPTSLSFQAAAASSAKSQTVNTPAIATLVLLAEQLRWLLDSGGLDFAACRTRMSSQILYEWAENTALAKPFVQEPAHRSPMVVTIDFDEQVDASELCRILRANGIVDVEPYRKLGRNQIRVGVYVSVDPDDVQALTKCLDWTLERL